MVRREPIAPRTLHKVGLGARGGLFKGINGVDVQNRRALGGHAGNHPGARSDVHRRPRTLRQGSAQEAGVGTDLKNPLALGDAELLELKSGTHGLLAAIAYISAWHPKRAIPQPAKVGSFT